MNISSGMSHPRLSQAFEMSIKTFRYRRSNTAMTRTFRQSTYDKRQWHRKCGWIWAPAQFHLEIYICFVTFTLDTEGVCQYIRLPVIWEWQLGKGNKIYSACGHAWIQKGWWVLSWLSNPNTIWKNGMQNGFTYTVSVIIDLFRIYFSVVFSGEK